MAWNPGCTFNVRLQKREVVSLGNGLWQAEFVTEGGQGAALLLNITPRLGFNRYIPDPDASIEAAARRWHDWFSSAPPCSKPTARSIILPGGSCAPG